MFDPYVGSLGTLFRGNVKLQVLDQICRRYATGDADPREAGGSLLVRWKQFAIDLTYDSPVTHQ